VSGAPLEGELHRSFTPWVEEHAKRIPGISDLGYDPKRYPAQRLGESKTDAGVLSRWVPSPVFLWVLGRKLASVLRSRERADRVIATFGDVASRVAGLLNSGKNVALLAGHTDNLFDIAYALAGLQISFGSTRYVRRTGIIVNKLMTREAFRGTPMVGTLKLLCNVYWVVPDTESTRRWGIPEEAARIVNSNALEALEEDLKRGVLVGIIPTGTAARHEVVDGELRLTMPHISPGTARLLERFDAFLPVAMWDDVPKAAPLCADLRSAVDALAAATAELAGASVAYHQPPVDGRPGVDRLVTAPTRPPAGSGAAGS
jgi:hypothetical protein